MTLTAQVTITVPISEDDLPRHDPEETILTAVAVSLIRNHPRICFHTLVEALHELHPSSFKFWSEHLLGESRGSEVHAAALNLLSDAHMSLLAIQDAIGNPHLYEPERPTLTAA
ncbi:MAG: hypothetical protein Q4F67_15640 [Propionibacteriaceae bacterium]|nr:hypothetical protein [Propionibacteriaceae bacterium]